MVVVVGVVVEEDLMLSDLTMEVVEEEEVEQNLYFYFDIVVYLKFLKKVEVEEEYLKSCFLMEEEVGVVEVVEAVVTDCYFDHY